MAVEIKKESEILEAISKKKGAFFLIIDCVFHQLFQLTVSHPPQNKQTQTTTTTPPRKTHDISPFLFIYLYLSIYLLPCIFLSLSNLNTKADLSLKNMHFLFPAVDSSEVFIKKIFSLTSISHWNPFSYKSKVNIHTLTYCLSKSHAG